MMSTVSISSGGRSITIVPQPPRPVVIQRVGVQGRQGSAGWSPVLAGVADGVRRVLQIIGWAGGQGDEPSIGGYIGPTGIVPDIASALDIRGATGLGVDAPALAALTGLSPAADRVPYYTSAASAALTPLTSFARTLLGSTSAITARTALGAQSVDKGAAADPYQSLYLEGASLRGRLWDTGALFALSIGAPGAADDALPPRITYSRTSNLWAMDGALTIQGSELRLNGQASNIVMAPLGRGFRISGTSTGTPTNSAGDLLFQRSTDNFVNSIVDTLSLRANGTVESVGHFVAGASILSNSNLTSLGWLSVASNASFAGGGTIITVSSNFTTAGSGTFAREASGVGITVGGSATISHPVAGSASGVAIGTTYGVSPIYFYSGGTADSARQYWKTGETMSWCSSTSGFTPGGTVIAFTVDPNYAFAPGRDNIQTLGKSGARWAQLWAGTATINTSDATEKQVLGEPDDDVLNAWGALRGVAYLFLDAVRTKGEEHARIHFGWVAQDVEAAFAAQGLDASRYALFCRDPKTRVEKQAVTRQRQKEFTEIVEVEKVEIVDGLPVLRMVVEERAVPVEAEHPLKDEDGAPVMKWVADPSGPDTHVVEGEEQPGRWEPRTCIVPVMEDYDEEIEVEVPDGDRLGLRYDECQCLEIAWLRRELIRHAARIDALETAEA
ncbi:tail fiber domain-containing protein [Xanthobacteraceae bacterium A53D]